MLFIDDLTRKYQPVDINDYAARIVISDELMSNVEYVNESIRHVEDNVIIETVRQANRSIGDWLNVRFFTHKLQEAHSYYPGRFEVAVKSQARAVATANTIVYRIADSIDALPETHNKFCKFCGGYTTDDMRGHCAACGGPRGWL